MCGGAIVTRGKGHPDRITARRGGKDEKSDPVPVRASESPKSEKSEKSEKSKVAGKSRKSKVGKVGSKSCQSRHFYKVGQKSKVD